LAVAQEPEPDFRREVLPILERACFECHGHHARRVRGGLRMDGRDALLAGGDSGPAVVPGDPDGSLLIQLVRHEIELFEMPPDEEDRLSEEEIAVLVRWVEAGADWPGGEVAVADEREIDLEAGREWWAFQPVRRPELPAVADPELAARVANPIDRFVFARLEAEGLPIAPEAVRRVLLRRLYLDVLGLPPTPEELDDFVSDRDPDRWAREVDRLLERPEYGERWARRWLDVVRFAQTSGYEKDAEKPHSWRYRDYVIDALNEDRPYDRFLVEQLAGDELEDPTEEALVATGFHHLGPWDSEPNDREQALLDGQDDVLRVVTEGFLGLTVGCARCHDHRTDPIRQRDYYSLLAFLRGVRSYDTPDYNADTAAYRLLGDQDELLARWEQRREQQAARLAWDLEQLMERLSPGDPPVDRDDPAFRRSLPMEDRLELFRLERELERIETSFEGGLPWALVAREEGPEAPATHVLQRGRALARRDLVEPAFPPVLCPDDASAEPDIAPTAHSSGRRLALARWIASPDHPTTARVIVNRIWAGYFGRGIVATPNDFGVTGLPPTHPELLDWLAAELVEADWSLKAIHRLILNSASYRLDSRLRSALAEERDPRCELLWRHPLRRLEAEVLHDSLLAVSGLLVRPDTDDGAVTVEPAGSSAGTREGGLHGDRSAPSEAALVRRVRGGRGFFPAVPVEALAGMSRPGSGWELSEARERNRRAVYAFVKRGLPVPFLTNFDAVDPTHPSGGRATTTVATQALTLQNGALASRCAEELALELLGAHPDDPTTAVEELFRRVLLRRPDAEELAVCVELLASQEAHFRALPPRLSVRPAFPPRLEIDFLAHLEPSSMLEGPGAGWSVNAGEWGQEYNMTSEAHRERGPVAFSQELSMGEGRLELELELDRGCRFAAVLLGPAGLQVELDAELEAVRLVHIGRESGRVVLVSSARPLPIGAPFELTVLREAGRARIELDGELVIAASVPPPEEAGPIGLRVVGEALHLLRARVEGLDGASHTHELTPRLAPEARALSLLCLTLFSLNEFLHAE
jgi:hypothetical protein